jgi:hypothetical protein
MFMFPPCVDECGLPGHRFNFILPISNGTLLGQIPPRNDLWDGASPIPTRRLAE